MTRRVVVLVGDPASPTAGAAVGSESSRLQALLGESDIHVTAITRGAVGAIPDAEVRLDLDPRDLPALDRVLHALGGAALHRRFAAFPLGRLLNSMGPLDTGRVLWRAIRRDRAALAALRSADIAIAADANAVKSAWIAGRRGWVSEATYDRRATSARRAS